MSNWFIDKLGPQPSGDISEAEMNRVIAQRDAQQKAQAAANAEQRKALEQKSAESLKQGIQRNAALPPEGPKPAPEDDKKKKKGWF